MLGYWESEGKGEITEFIIIIITHIYGNSTPRRTTYTAQGSSGHDAIRKPSASDVTRLRARTNEC